MPTSVAYIFQRVEGVISVESGYAGGHVANPTYEQVCSDETGHAESIQVNFDPNKISYEKLLEVFFKVHNPTTLNRQGADEGSQYRSVIFYHNKRQKDLAEKAKSEIFKTSFWGNAPIVTEIKPYIKFYSSEAYHKNYYNNHLEQGYCQAVIEPKIKKLQLNFRNLLKK